MAKIEQLRRKFIRPAPRPIIELQPDEVAAFVKTDEPDAFWVKTTPEVMQTALNLMGPNRSLKEKNCDRITRDMVYQHFVRTNIGLGFNCLGQMFDGKNRGTALVRSGETQIMLWVIGLPVEAQGAIDNGALRTFADELKIQGHHHYPLLAAATQWLYNFKLSEPDPDKKASEQRMKVEHASLAELREIRKKHELLAESCVFEEKIRLKLVNAEDGMKNLLPPSLLVATHYVGAVLLNDRDNADSFIERLLKWPYRDAQDMPYAWGKFLYDRQLAHTRAGRSMRAIGTIQAWNGFREGRDMKGKKWRDGSLYAAFASLDYSKI